MTITPWKSIFAQPVDGVGDPGTGPEAPSSKSPVTKPSVSERQEDGGELGLPAEAVAVGGFAASARES